MPTPRYVPMDAERVLVQALVAYGVPQESMRLELYTARHELLKKAGQPIPDDKPISLKLLRRAYRTELDTGLDRANGRVAEGLYKRAIDLKHPQGAISAMFWMKTRGGWSEKSRIEHTGKDGKPIEFDLLSDATLEEVEVLERVLARREAKLRLVGGTDVDAAA